MLVPSKPFPASAMHGMRLRPWSLAHESGATNRNAYDARAGTLVSHPWEPNLPASAEDDTAIDRSYRSGDCLNGGQSVARDAYASDMNVMETLGREPQPTPASVDLTVALIRDHFPNLVGVERSLQTADDGHGVVVLNAVSCSSGDEVRRAYHGFLRRWDAAVPPEQRRYLRVVFALRRP